jgi:GWxTD domain-containing protein
MPHRLKAFMALFAFIFAGAAAAAAASLDKDEKEWLEEVRPIILKVEQETFKDLEERAERDEFRKIFWKRRDPNLETPENEFQAAFEVSKAKADEEYAVMGRRGAWTDCGRVYILLGDPDDSEVQVGSASVLQRVPEVWIYRDRPGQTFSGGEARVAFDGLCRVPGSFAGELEEIAASKVLWELDYRKGEDGRLVSLEDQLPKETPAQALLKAPRQDFPLTISVSYLRISEGVTGVVGMVRGEAADLETREQDGQQVADVLVVTGATTVDGEDAGWTEQPVVAVVQEDGSFLASFGVALPPGTYGFKAGAVLGAEGPAGSMASQEIEVPDFSRVETAADGSTVKVPTVASIIFIKDIQEAKDSDPTHAFAAYRLGTAQLIPLYGREFLQSDTISFFYLIYDLATAPGTEKGDATVAFSILKNGRTPVAQAPANPVDSAMVASSIGPVPLGGYAPGEYAVQLRVIDKISKKTLVQNEKFTIVAPEGGAE